MPSAFGPLAAAREDDARESVGGSNDDGDRASAVLLSSRVASDFDTGPDTMRFIDSSSSMRAARPSERRAARRVPLEVSVLLSIDGDPGDVLGGTSEDISTSGIFVRTAKLLPSGKRVRVRFSIPQGAIEAIGIVVRFRTPGKQMLGGVGLCFEALSDAQLESIEAFCDSSGDAVP